MTIQDYKAGNPQTQTFTYDALDRLRTAGAAGGTGGTYATGTYTYSATGNILNMPGVGNYIYGPTLSGCALDVNGPKPHAVMTAGSHSFAYDCNGNMTTRTIAGTAYTLAYDPENRMTGVTGGGVSASFVYDGDGNRVLATVGGVTTVYLGNYWERDMTAGVPKRYYYAGGLRVGVRTGTTTLNYLFGDHLGSTSKVANSSGGFVSEVRYMPFGQDRYTSGTTPTTYRFTGQRQESELGGPGGLYFFNARWYDSLTGRWTQPDTIVPEPGNPQSLNRYSMVLNNPVKYTDPTGHRECDLQCQIENEPVDPIRIHEGEHYHGGCWGAIDCLGLGKVVTDIDNFDIGNIVLQGGYSADIFMGIGGRGDVGGVVDGKGNIGMTLSLGGGGYSAVGVGTGPVGTVYDAPSIHYLQGWSVQVGGQAGQAATVNVERILFRGGDRERYSGTSISTQAQLQGPWPGELHATSTHTWVLFSVNIPDAIANFVRSLH